MKLPDSLLNRVAGALLAAGVLACGPERDPRGSGAAPTGPCDDGPVTAQPADGGRHVTADPIAAPHSGEPATVQGTAPGCEIRPELPEVMFPDDCPACGMG